MSSTIYHNEHCWHYISYLKMLTLFSPRKTTGEKHSFVVGAFFPHLLHQALFAVSCAYWDFVFVSRSGRGWTGILFPTIPFTLSPFGWLGWRLSQKPSWVRLSFMGCITNACIGILWRMLCGDLSSRGALSLRLWPCALAKIPGGKASTTRLLRPSVYESAAWTVPRWKWGLRSIS